MFRIVTVALICILSGAEVDLFTPSFPELQRVFNLTPFMVQFTLSANFIAYCVCSLFAGTLGDRYSKRAIILTSLAVFVVGSLFCVTATSFGLLILGRFLQGVGISGPSVLGNVVIIEDCPPEKQPAMMGLMNGVVTLAMAVAPVLGSYVNLYFNWRGNFFVLLILGMLCFVMGYFAIPYKKGDASVSLSLSAYLPLLRSEKLLTFVFGVCFMMVPYWLFIGMSPILYMQDLGVELKEFGFYQGILSVVFSTISLLMSRILRHLGQERSLLLGLVVCGVSAVLIFMISVLGFHDPVLITGTILVFSAGAVLPINILYPMSLEALENTKSRTAAVISAVRLVMTAVFLELVGLFYNGKFFPIGIAMSLGLLFSFLFIRKLYLRSWIRMSSNSLELSAIH